MDKKQSLFIYERKEVVVLVLLALMVALFAFTLGVHLGKRVGPKPILGEMKDTPPIETVADQVPSRVELSEQAKGLDQASDQALTQALHDEVGRTGVKLETPRQVDLPTQTRAEKIQKTETSPPTETSTASEKTESVAQQGLRYTLQVGSFPNEDEAKQSITKMGEAGLGPLSIFPAEIRGKGTWYRVYLGAFNTKEDAEKLGQELRTSNKLDSYVIVNRP